ncbi:hypothetical protein CA13_39400 [Planctomycetes bacterium CA13]|uniref:Uncharacterized protein n=1 Tax=Novipirellula herctigrandis TaxID=2527986 RepID=A0A5C5Z5Y7_9BACT|nr:hypothetical protein CA13_39400 [Planctomycetes bacterium CA13]
MRLRKSSKVSLPVFTQTEKRGHDVQGVVAFVSAIQSIVLPVANSARRQ